MEFEIRYALVGGFGGLRFREWETIGANDLDEANMFAYEEACQLYESYDGLHGLRSHADIMKEDNLLEEDAETVWFGQRESWIAYEARPAEHQGRK